MSDDIHAAEPTAALLLAYGHHFIVPIGTFLMNSSIWSRYLSSWR